MALISLFKKPQKKPEVILESNSDMKLLHLYNDPSISLQDIENILSVIKQGDFVGVEKADGYNIRVTWRNNELYVARNKTEIASGGLNLDGLFNKNFLGGRKVKDVFLNAYEVIQDIFFEINSNELNKIFLEHQNLWINCEIISQENNNFLKYDTDWILFHRVGTAFFEPGTSKKISGVDINPFFDHFINNLPDRISSGWKFGEDPEFTFSGALNFQKINKYLKVMQNFYFENNIPADQSFKDAAQAISPDESFEDALEPVLSALYSITIELLNGASSKLNKNSFSSTHNAKAVLTSAIKACKNYDGPNAEYVKKIYDKNINKIDAKDFDTSIEGVIFKWGSKYYKITGMFAPANQIVGLYTMGAKGLEPLKNHDKEDNGNWTELETETLKPLQSDSNKKATYLYPGSFKPPHMGHYEVLEAMVNDSNKFPSSKIIIFISQKSKFTDASGLEITADDSKQIWEMMIRNFENVEIRLSNFDTPIKDVFEFIQSEAQQGEQVFVSVSTKDERSDRFKKIPEFAESKGVVANTKVFQEIENVSSTMLRKAIDSHSPSAIFEYMPGIFTKEDKDQIWEIIFKKKVKQTPSSEEYSVLSEEVEQFSDIKSVSDKSDLLSILPFQNIFGDKTRIVTPLILQNRDSVDLEELTKLIDDSNWMLDPFFENVTKTIDGKLNKMPLSDYLDKFILVVSKLLISKSLKSQAKNRVIETLFHLTDYDETQLIKKYGNLVDLLAKLNKIRESVEDFSETTSDFSVIISRHPNDIEKMFKINLESDDFYENLINLKDRYIISYVVSKDSLPKDLESEEFQFSTNISSLNPISKLKINKIYSKKEKYELAIPENDVFGKFKTEHLENVTNFLRNSQNIDVFEAEDGAFFDVSDFYIYDRRDINSDLDRYFSTNFFTKSNKKPVFLKQDSSRIEKISEEAQQWLSSFYKGFEDFENIKKIRLTSSFLPYDNNVRNFNVDYIAEIRIDISELDVLPNTKSWLMAKLDDLDDNIDVIRTKSYIDIIDNMLEMEINCRYIENDLDGFEQAEYFKHFSEKIDRFMKHAFKKKIKEAPTEVFIQNSDTKTQIDYKNKLTFKKFVTPKDWEPELGNSMIISDDHFELGFKYITEIYGIEGKQLPVDVFYFNEHLSDFSTNETECSFFVKFVCRPNDLQKLVKKLNEKNFTNLTKIIENKFKEHQMKVIDSVLRFLIDGDSKNDDEYQLSEEIYENLINFYDLRFKDNLL